MFKIGDRVKCIKVVDISRLGLPNLVLGAIYTVKKAHALGVELEFMDNAVYYNEEVELVSKAAKSYATVKAEHEAKQSECKCSFVKGLGHDNDCAYILAKAA